MGMTIAEKILKAHLVDGEILVSLVSEFGQRDAPFPLPLMLTSRWEGCWSIGRKGLWASAPPVDH